MKRVHVMIDFEGCGEIPLALGAVQWNPTAEICNRVGEEFYRVINGFSCEKLGMKSDIGTFYWWMRQEKEAQEALLENREPLVKVMNDFIDWLKGLPGIVIEDGRFRNLELWAFGTSYDIPMLERSIKATMPKRKFPFSFRQFNDARTILRQFGIELHEQKREGVYHNALDDCHFQVQQLFRCRHLLLQNKDGEES